VKKQLGLISMALVLSSCAGSIKTTSDKRTPATSVIEESVEVACIVTNPNGKRVLFQYSREGENKSMTRDSLSEQGCLSGSEKSAVIDSSSEELVEGDLAVIVDFRIPSLSRSYQLFYKKDFSPTTHQLSISDNKGEVLATYVDAQIECHEVAYSPPSRCEGH
jgi:hypothetical protein